MFSKILIANRGEIAVRVARTARRMGVRTVAVYSDADRDAMHVAACDEAFHIGGAAPKDSYLRGDKILEVAKKSGAQAIHPGYGFLSENEDFARKCAKSNIVFVGPTPEAIEAMGLKAESKRLMEKAGVPLVPGYHGEAQDDALLAKEAERIGFPVLIKASAGGGGKGMKVAESAAEFAQALASAKREAKNSFGDDNVLIERYLKRSRHIEIQVFGDTHGNCVYLFERDCSLQRRHQKVIEEAPAPGMTPAMRKQMGEAAVAAAKAVAYVGAGTVEFIAEHDVAQSGRFYFMEMNTRLQVEHPVTEMITGLDLVEWQLRVASGERLPKLQDELQINGHAFEARIYAENPRNQFLPAIGKIEQLRAPCTSASASVRIDTGVREGDEITPNYDPMIAKLVVHAPTRTQALARLADALDEYAVIGFANNVEFLQRTARHPAFINADIDTGFIAKHSDALLPPLPAPSDAALAACALVELHRARAASASDASPWARADGFWLGQPNQAIRFRYQQHDQAYEVGVLVRDAGYMLTLPSGAHCATAAIEGEAITLTMNTGAGESKTSARVLQHGLQRVVLLHGERYEFNAIDPYAPPHEDEAHAGHLTAPMPGSVVSVLVKAGDKVAKGQPLIIMEAMKMEHTIVAPFEGKVEAVYFAAKEQVKEGAELVALEAE
ncbi:MAG: acetyl/propionyl/methylcrotonyl-CoA carboxylase subunit alpha [Betaproteobacteria bacterium]|nr:MAG: acetyl/propionyl/methylcrotonyl-CoA carboxylase subunit alpha [Betaproteobacteria bacterium]